MMSRKLTTIEVAELLRMRPDRVRNLAKAGVLPPRRAGDRGRLLFDEADVEAAPRLVGRAEPAAAGIR
jgi:DNA-binding transcriptional MerR regulator